MTKSKLTVPIIIAVLLVGGGAFYSGMQYSKSQSGTFTPPQMGQTRGEGRSMFVGAPGAAQARNAGGMATGEIVAKDADSLTLKLNDGGSKIIFHSSSTTITKMATISIDEISEGTNVMITGTANQDGSVTANSIQIRSADEMRRFLTPPPEDQVKTE
ncbi:MAG: hypothetical protein ABII13_05505 [Patescibacteria group bacterium]